MIGAQSHPHNVAMEINQMVDLIELIGNLFEI